MEYESIEYGVLSIGEASLRVAGGSPRWQVAGNIFGYQVSAIGYQVRVRVRDLNLYLEAETRDLRIR